MKRRRSSGEGSLFKRQGRPTWVASWYNDAGQRQTKTTGTTDKQAATRILGKWVADAALRRSGVVDASADRHAKAARKPIAEHLDDFVEELRARGNTTKHVSQTESRAKRVLRLAGIESVGDLELRQGGDPSSDFLLYRDHAGGVADFHALRHTYVSRLVGGGVSVKVAQELARHSTPTLTIGRYSHVRLHDLTGALNSLPSTTDNTESESMRLRKTGTNDVACSAQRHGQQLGCISQQDGATWCESGAVPQVGTDEAHALGVARVSATVRHNAREDDKDTERTRSPGSRIASPTR